MSLVALAGGLSSTSRARRHFVDLSCSVVSCLPQSKTYNIEVAYTDLR